MNMLLALYMATGLAFTSAFNVAAPAMRQVSFRAKTISMAEDIMSTAATLEGPGIFWGSDGPTMNPPKEENDIKGYDNFGKFVAAVESAGLADTLKSGEYTVLAPTDSAIDEFKGEITPEILKYHIIPGKVPTSSLSSSELKTMEGSSLTYRRFARKDFLDEAMVGVKSAGASCGQNYPSDVECSNGLIHSLNMVLVPGAYSP